VLKDLTAAELADVLDHLRTGVPHNSGGLSMLDEATLAFGRKSADLYEAQRPFGQARLAHMRSYTAGAYSNEAWQRAVDAAERLATMLWALGDVRIARCKQQAGWGTCNLPLDEQGECRFVRQFHEAPSPGDREFTVTLADEGGGLQDQLVWAADEALVDVAVRHRWPTLETRQVVPTARVIDE
jgi:hypothetical protein